MKIMAIPATRLKSGNLWRKRADQARHAKTTIIASFLIITTWPMALFHHSCLIFLKSHQSDQTAAMLVLG